MLRHDDHTEEITTRSLPLPVASTDCCRYFERRTNTIFNGHDCWHCKYGEFGIDTDAPSEQGICTYQEKQ